METIYSHFITQPLTVRGRDTSPIYKLSQQVNNNHSNLGEDSVIYIYTSKNHFSDRNCEEKNISYPLPSKKKQTNKQNPASMRRNILDDAVIMFSCVGGNLHQTLP